MLILKSHILFVLLCLFIYFLQTFEDIAPNLNIKAKDLVRDRFLGKGTFGSVFRGELKLPSGDTLIVAMKMPLNNEVDEQAKPEEKQAAQAAERALRDNPTMALNDAYRYGER